MDMSKQAYSQEYKLSPIDHAQSMDQMRSESYTSHRSEHEFDPTRVVEEFGIGVGEAADMYGDLETAEDYGYVTRGYVKLFTGRLRGYLEADDLDQTQISAYPIYCPRRNDRDWSLLGNRTGFHTSWSS